MPSRLLRAFGAVLAALVVFVGMPVGLYHFGRNPWPTLSAFAHDPMIRDDGTLLLAVVTITGWAAWVYFIIGLLVELIGRILGRGLLIPGLGPAQWLASLILAALTATTLASTVAGTRAATHIPTAEPRPAAAISTVEQNPSRHGGDTTPTPLARETHVAHVVQRGETILDLAERYYQDPDAITRIIDANVGIPQFDGRTLHTGQVHIRPGWTLRIPSPTVNQAMNTAVPPPAMTAAINTYQVCGGDTLWDIAESQLGDPEAWQLIWELNKGHTFDDGRTFTRPGLIHTGWVLTLPDTPHGQIVTPAPAKPTPPPDSYLKRHAHDGDEQPTLPARQPATLPDSGGVSTPTAGPAGTPNHQAPTASPAVAAHRDGAGIDLPSGSWISVGLAAALAGAARLVWLHRRRRYTPQPPSPRPRTSDPDLFPTPAVIRQVRAHLAHTPTIHSEKANPPRATAETPAPQSPPPAAPADPAAVTPAAGRGILIAALAAGSDDIDERGHVVIAADLLSDLIPAATAADVAAQSRLIVTSDSDSAADWCEQQLLRRTRILAEHDQPDAAALRDSDPFAEPMPPITLLTGTEDLRARIGAIAAQGGPVNLNWVPVSPSAFPGAETNAVHAAVLTPAEALDLLRTLTESHTGQPQPSTGKEHDAAGHDDEKSQVSASGPGNAAEPGTELGSPDHIVAADLPSAQQPQPIEQADCAVLRLPVQVSVLGPLEIHKPVGFPDIKRNKPWELLAYLIAVGGRASNNAIVEDLLPDAPRSKAAGQMHTMVTGLRNLLIAAAGGGESEDYLTHPPGFYVLQPDVLDVDLWRFRAALKTAATATSPGAKADALRRALAEVKGRFADGSVFEWMETISVGITRQILDARVALASTLAELGQPQQALEVLQDAIDEEPLAEDLYRQAMDLHADLGDADAVRRLRHILTHLLEQHGMEPTDDLSRHIDNLLAKLRRRRAAQAQQAAAAYADTRSRGTVR